MGDPERSRMESCSYLTTHSPALEGTPQEGTGYNLPLMTQGCAVLQAITSEPLTLQEPQYCGNQRASLARDNLTEGFICGIFGEVLSTPRSHKTLDKWLCPLSLTQVDTSKVLL